MITYDLKNEISSPLNSNNNIHIFENKKLLVPEQFLIENSKLIPFNFEYNYRPDLVSFEEYGNLELYQYILYANKVGSIFQFNKINLNNQIIVPNIEFINNYLR